MNHRERVLRTMQFEPVDALPLQHSFGLMPGVLEEWHAQGLPTHITDSREDIARYFCMPAPPHRLPVNLGLLPPFKVQVLEETPECRRWIDEKGRRVKLMKRYATLPLPEEYPVWDRATWENYRPRVQFTPQRIADDLEIVAARNLREGNLNVFATSGFYSFPRGLMGDEALCVAYFEQPELIEDMLETWCSLVEQALGKVAQRVKLDHLHLGEDVAYRNGPLIGPNIFERFMRPYYERLGRLVLKHEIPIFSVDSDGRLDRLIEWMAPLGVNLIGPNEVQAGCNVVAYRKQYAQNMCYEGGFDKRVLLEDRDAIDAMLKAAIQPMKESGGGWIMGLDHRVLHGTRLENFSYYVQRVQELGRYS